jgi:two-component system LytT family response regulator
MNNTYRVLVVDDEGLAREAITLRLQSFPNFELCGEADNGNDAIVLSKLLKPDVIFMDIEMPEIGGIKAAQAIVANGEVLIVFVSAYSHYALEAFRVNAIDYLLKPINDPHFEQMLARLESRLLDKQLKLDQRVIKVLNELQDPKMQLNTDYLKRIAVKVSDTTLMINLDDVESIVSAKDYLCIKVKGIVYIHRCTMKQIDSFLDPSKFLRTHRSHIVNLNCITRLEQGTNNKFIMTFSGDKHPVSRRYFNDVKIFIGQLKP